MPSEAHMDTDYSSLADAPEFKLQPVLNDAVVVPETRINIRFVRVFCFWVVIVLCRLMGVAYIA